jgi:hypothetical protein
MDDKFLASAVAKMKTDAMVAPAPAPPAAAATPSAGGADKSGVGSGGPARIAAAFSSCFCVLLSCALRAFLEITRCCARSRVVVGRERRGGNSSGSRRPCCRGSGLNASLILLVLPGGVLSLEIGETKGTACQRKVAKAARICCRTAAALKQSSNGT